MSESNSSKISALLVTGLVLPITMAACGGGGGGSVATPPPPVNTAALPITGNNAQDVTESVLDAVSSSTNLIDITDVVGLPVIGSPGQGTTKPAFGDVLTQVTACDTGEMTTTWNDADNNLQVSTGDTFDAQFTMCFLQDPGVTLDGASIIDNLVVTGDPANQVVPWGLAATFGYVELTATDAENTVIINGDLDLDMSSDDNVIINASAGSALLSAEVNGVNESLSEYLVAHVIDQNTLMSTISADGIYASDVLEGSVTFETIEGFVLMGDENPSSGQLLISDTNSSVRVTALDNLNVQLDIDFDLDGTIDETIVVTWAELDIG
jgi:hypothetical protein